MLEVAINLVLAYSGWLATIYSASKGMPYIGVIAILILLMIHFRVTQYFKADLALLFSMALMGTIIDSSYIHAGLITYRGGYPGIDWLAPLWITSLWALFSISFNHSMVWLGNYTWLTIVLGALGAPSTYLAAVRLGAAEFNAPRLICLIVVGAVWAFVFPLLFKYSRWLRIKLGA